jgi:hypothetical protein
VLECLYIVKIIKPLKKKPSVMCNKNYLLAVTLFFLLYLPLFAQDCSKSKVSKQCDPPKDSRFENIQNLSKSFKKGQTKQYILTFIKGKTYYISICSKEVSDIHIKLREANDTQDVLYDNAIDELRGILDITNKETKKLIVEISLPHHKMGESSSAVVCVGMRIYSRKTN